MDPLISTIVAFLLTLLGSPGAEPEPTPPISTPVVIDLTEPTVPATTVPPTTTIPEPVCDWTQGRTGQPAACYVYPA